MYISFCDKGASTYLFKMYRKKMMNRILFKIGKRNLHVKNTSFIMYELFQMLNVILYFDIMENRQCQIAMHLLTKQITITLT